MQRTPSSMTPRSTTITIECTFFVMFLMKLRFSCEIAALKSGALQSVGYCKILHLETRKKKVNVTTRKVETYFVLKGNSNVRKLHQDSAR